MPESRFETPGPVRLRVNVNDGSVTVNAVDGLHETTVSVVERGRSDERATVVCRRVGDVSDISIEAGEQRLFGLFGGRSRIETHVRVTCPTRTEVDVNTVDAPVKITGQVGETNLRTVSGELEVEEVAGSASLRTISGDASAREISGDARVHTVSGDVELTGVGSAAVLRSISGDFRVGSVFGPVTFDSVSGDLDLGSVAEGAVKVKTVSGDVNVGIRSGSRVWIDARSLGGSTTSDLPITEEAVNEPGPLVEFSAFAASGDIRVVRAG